MTTKTRIAVGESYDIAGLWNMSPDLCFSRWSATLIFVNLTQKQDYVLGELGEALLEKGTWTVAELSILLEMSAQSVRYYLNKLQDKGYLSWSREGTAVAIRLVMTPDLSEWLYDRHKDRLKFWERTLKQAEKDNADWEWVSHVHWEIDFECDFAGEDEH